MERSQELEQEKFAIQGANNALQNALEGWIVNVGLGDKDAELARAYLKDMMGDTVDVRLKQINREIEECQNVG